MSIAKLTIKQRFAMALFSVIILSFVVFVSPEFSNLSFDLYRDHYVYLTNYDIAQEIDCPCKEVQQNFLALKSDFDYIELQLSDSDIGDFEITIYQNDEIVSSLSSKDCLLLKDNWIRIPLNLNSKFSDSELTLKIVSDNDLPICLSYSSNPESQLVSNGYKTNFSLAIREPVTELNSQLLLIIVSLFSAVLVPFCINQYSLRTFIILSLIIGITLCVFVTFPYNKLEREDFVISYALSNGIPLSTVYADSGRFGYWLPSNILNPKNLLSHIENVSQHTSFYPIASAIKPNYANYLLSVPLLVRNVFSLDLSASILICRLFVFLIYFLLSVTAIKKSVLYKPFTITVLLLGQILFGASTFSLLSLAFATLVLFLVIVISSCEGNRCLSAADSFFVSLCLLIFGLAVPLLLLPFVVFVFLPLRFKNKFAKISLYVMLPIVFSFIVAAYTFFFTRSQELLSLKLDNFIIAGNNLLLTPLNALREFRTLLVSNLYNLVSYNRFPLQLVLPSLLICFVLSSATCSDEHKLFSSYQCYKPACFFGAIYSPALLLLIYLFQFEAPTIYITVLSALISLLLAAHLYINKAFLQVKANNFIMVYLGIVGMWMISCMFSVC